MLFPRVLRPHLCFLLVAFAGGVTIATALAAPPGTDSEGLAFRNPPAPLTMAEAAMGGETGPFYPSFAQTGHGGMIPEGFFLRSQSCGNAGCHPDIVREWESSTHAHSSLDNPWYRRSLEYTQDVAGVATAKWCGGCHSPALLLSGQMDRPIAEVAGTPAGHAGVTCTSCHAISAVGSTMGQAHYTLTVPPRHERLTTGSSFARWLERMRIRRNPEEHRNAYMKPFYGGLSSGAYCSTCHKSHLDAPVNGLRWVREANDYDQWQASSISGFGGRSYYRPEKPQGCVDCHMPLVRSNDAGNDGGRVRSHRFAAANSALPAWRGDREQIRKVEESLRNAVTLDIFAMTEPRTATEAATGPARVFAPLDRIPATVRHGEMRRIDVVVRNRGVGHLFPGGKQDTYDCWLELKAVDDRGRTIFWSGRAGEDSPVDPSAHAYRIRMVDEHRNPIDKRNFWAARAFVYQRRIMPNTAEIVRYRLEIPPDAGDSITLTARLNYRKASWWYNRWVFAGRVAPGQEGRSVAIGHDDRAFDVTGPALEGGEVPRLPIVVVAEDRVTLKVVPAGAPLPDLESAQLDPATDLERFNDYGIGLFFQRDMHTARWAFEKVADLAPESPEGWASLGQVLQTDSDLEGARRQVERALTLDPEHPRARFLLGQIEKAAGNRAKALEHLRRIETRYPYDRLVLMEIASVLSQEQDYRGAVGILEWVVAIDSEERAAHYELMRAYRALGENEKAERHRQLYERFAPLGENSLLDVAYWSQHPHENNERQIVHEHTSAPLEGSAAPAKGDP